jgi:hypothetical protein
VGGVDRRQAQPRGEHPVEGGRRAAALDVAEHRRPRVEAGALADLAFEQLADAAEPLVAELVLAAPQAANARLGRV